MIYLELHILVILLLWCLPWQIDACFGILCRASLYEDVSSSIIIHWYPSISTIYIYSYPLLVHHFSLYPWYPQDHCFFPRSWELQAGATRALRGMSWGESSCRAAELGSCGELLHMQFLDFQGDHIMNICDYNICIYVYIYIYMCMIYIYICM
jgi:hypothetical protein